MTEEEINERRGRRMKKDMYGRNIISEVEMPELKGAPKEKRRRRCEREGVWQARASCAVP